MKFNNNQHEKTTVFESLPWPACGSVVHQQLGPNLPWRYGVLKEVYGWGITSDGTYVTIKTNGQPDHKSVYYATTNSKYESFSGTTLEALLK
jgi:hypothetical protein